jgi:hypothetical protein
VSGRHVLPESGSDQRPPLVYFDHDWGWVRSVPTANPYVSGVLEILSVGTR